MRDYHSELAKRESWIVKDWAGNLMDFGRFKSFEDAEEFLSEKLGDNYATDREEYYFERHEMKKAARSGL